MPVVAHPSTRVGIRPAASAPAPVAPSVPAIALPSPDLGAPPAVTPPLSFAPQVSAPSSTQPVGRIAAINIAGNVRISQAAIQAVLSQKVGTPYNPQTALNDREAIKSMGYFNGEIGMTVTQDPAGGVDITYTVVENPIVKKIVFTANTPGGQPTIAPAVLKSHMYTVEGQVLNTNILSRDLDILFNGQTGWVHQQGYVFDVSQDINIDPNTGVLTIPLIETHIAGIQIKGNKKTKSIVITRELHSKAGDVLNEQKLQKDLTKIFNLGLFDQVGPFQEDPVDLGLVTVVIPVTEKRSGQVSVGVGYSSLQKLVGRAELAENNFRGLGEHVSLTWEVGGIASATSVELSFVEPYLDKHHTSGDIDIFDKAVYRFSSDTFGGGVGSTNIYIEQHIGAIIGANRPLSDTASAGVTARYESVKADNVQLPPQDLFIRQVGTVGALAVHGLINTRDVDSSPASGGLRSASLEYGVADTSSINNAPSPLVPGQHSFVKTGIDLRQYISLQGPRKPGDFKTGKTVFAVRLLLGSTNKGIPFFEQYFLGGADSLRGYDQDRFWGSNLALFQGELRIPFSKENNVQGVLLTDVGDAWGSIYQDSALQQHSKLSLQSDFGVGIRLVTPVGPIRLDYAVGKDGGRTQFSIGQSF